MQKYINALFLVIILGLTVYIVRGELKGDIKKLSDTITAQQQAIASVQASVQQVVEFLNKQQSASSAGQGQGAQQQGAPGGQVQGASQQRMHAPTGASGQAPPETPAPHSSPSPEEKNPATEPASAKAPESTPTETPAP